MKYIYSVILCFIFSTNAVSAAWRSVETQNFTIIYQSHLQHIVPRVTLSAEISLTALKRIFQYHPSEKITLILNDYRDSGGGRATALPHNKITLNVAPITQTDYESIHFDEQFMWIISHELVHIAMSDQSSDNEQLLRNFVGKVAPIKDPPISLPFSLLTNRNRFTPNWYQEGIATFMETWFNGGYGRALGSFDEMFFRTITYEKEALLPWFDVDNSDESFMLGMSSYLYGTRFMSYLAIEHGVENVIDWVTVKKDQGHIDFQAKFEQAFGVSMNAAWNRFSNNEKIFQEKNISRLSKYEFTPTKKIGEPLGWVTKPLVESSETILLSSLRPHTLASIEQLNVNTQERKTLSSLITPTMITVSQTAYSKKQNKYFYTTHNDRGYRDLWSVSVDTGDQQLIAKDARLGELTVDAHTQNIYAIQVQGTSTQLVMLSYPYQTLMPLIALPRGSMLSQLSVGPQGKHILATLRQPSKKQSIIIISIEKMLKEGKLKYRTISDKGNPEHPSWGVNGESIFWNAYQNGVSNAYTKIGGVTTAISNSPTGVFFPTEITENKMFAYEFTTKGFQPVTFELMPTEGLAAIEYFGQRVVRKNPQVKEWRLSYSNNETSIKNDHVSEPTEYNGIEHLKTTALIPDIASYARHTVLGAYWEMEDPISAHRLSFKFGVSKSNDMAFRQEQSSRSNRKYNWHVEGQYQFLDTFKFGIQHLPASFYDLANQSDVNRVQKSVFGEYKNYWLYDRPSVITQSTFVKFSDWNSENFKDISSEKSFSFGTRFDFKKTRKTIGSVDDEYGWKAKVQGIYIKDFKNSKRNSHQITAQADWVTPIFQPHNILRVQAGIGKTVGDEIGEGLFYFEGIGQTFFEKETKYRQHKMELLAGLGNAFTVADRFFKTTIENRFPSVKLGFNLGSTYIKRADFSLFHQRLYTSFQGNKSHFYNFGVVNNLYIKNFYVMDATFSFGFAKVWLSSGRTENEAFAYLKLFRF